MHWNQPVATSRDLGFYFQPSNEVLASLLVTNFKDFNFDYFDKLNYDSQLSILYQLEDIYDRNKNSIDAVCKIYTILSDMIKTRALCVFIILGKRYTKFEMLRVSRVSDSNMLVELARDYQVSQEYRDKIDDIIRSVIISKGQGTKISDAVRSCDSLTPIFEYNIPYVVNNLLEVDNSVTVARNISHTGAKVSKSDYDAISQNLLTIFLHSDPDISTNTVKKHMKKIICEE